MRKPRLEIGQRKAHTKYVDVWIGKILYCSSSLILCCDQLRSGGTTAIIVWDFKLQWSVLLLDNPSHIGQRSAQSNAPYRRKLAFISGKGVSYYAGVWLDRHRGACLASNASNRWYCLVKPHLIGQWTAWSVVLHEEEIIILFLRRCFPTWYVVHRCGAIYYFKTLSIRKLQITDIFSQAFIYANANKEV